MNPLYRVLYNILKDLRNYNPLAARAQGLADHFKRVTPGFRKCIYLESSRESSGKSPKRLFLTFGGGGHVLWRNFSKIAQ